MDFIYRPEAGVIYWGDLVVKRIAHWGNVLLKGGIQKTVEGSRQEY